jgi:periplasmic protein TonB
VNSRQPSLMDRVRRYLPRIIAAAVVIAIVGMIWHMAESKVGVRREAPRIATITPLPPPPPPPKEKPPEPKKMEEEKQVVDKPEPMKPVDAPKQSNDVAKQVTINSDAQAGSDSFNIGAGSGGGMVGSGGGTGTGTGSYDQYLGYAIQQAIQRDERTRRLAFDVRANLWIGSGNNVDRIELVSSSGSQATDEALESVLRGLHIDTSPPTGVSMPVRIAMHGHRPG